MDEVTAVLHASAVFHQVALAITPRRIAPVSEGPHWYALPTRRAHAPAAAAQTSGGFALRAKQMIDGGRADIQQPASYHWVQPQMAVALHRVDQHRDEFSKALTADAISCFPQHG